MMSIVLRAASVGVCCIVALATSAQAQDPYYKGKRLSVLVNYAAGGPTDIEGRLFAKHLGKHIPGNPNVIVQNMDGAGGMIGANFLGEVAPKDGTVVGYFTGATWRYINTPQNFRVDFKTYEFVGFQPGTSVYFVRTDVEPGLKQASDLVKATNLIAGGLGPENAKDLLIRLTLDMLGMKYGYVSPYRGSAAARMALQQREINFYSESPPSYRSLIEPNLVKTGEVLPVWYDPGYDGSKFSRPKQVEGLAIQPFHEFFRSVRGKLPSGQLWDIYRSILLVNGAMQRLSLLPPGVPQIAVDALRQAVGKLNDDKDYIAEAVKTLGYIPEWETGSDINQRVRSALSANPNTRAFIVDYVKAARKKK
jgi:tripartite-type tricarboxylate transporter receptor subunit TctC